jgi:hypothetical protein
MKKTVLVIIACLLSTIFLGNAFAGRQWNFQRVADSQGTAIGGGNTAIGMRSGATWPVVVTNTATAAMVPGGWARTTGGLGTGPGPMGPLDGATSHDGKSMVFASGYGEILTFGSSGWNRSSILGWGWKSSVAFTRDNNPAVLTNSGNSLTLSVRNAGQWYSNSLGRTADNFALDYDSYNQANVVYSQGNSLIYGTKGALTGNQWNFSQYAMELPPVDGPLDLALNSNDVPFVTYRTNSTGLVCSTYNRAQGQWTSNTISSLVFNNYCMASDSQGGIGIAYVTNSPGYDTIGFTYINGDQSWSTDSLWTAPSNLMFDMGIGLAFDAENNPVISYNTGGEVWIAYDPMVIPEPATMSLLLLGTMVSLRLRRSK